MTQTTKSSLLRYVVIPALFGVFPALGAPVSALTLNDSGLAEGLSSSGQEITSQQNGAITVLEAGRPITSELSGAQVYSYQVVIPEHECVRVVVEQLGVDVTVQVLDGSGVSLAEYDSDSRKQGQEALDLVADSAATYQLNIKANYPKIAAGRYRIEVAQVRPATDKDRDEFEAHKLASQSKILRYSGKSEEALKLAQRALELAEKALGPDDDYVGEIAMRIGQLDRVRGEYDTGEAILKRSIAIYDKNAKLQDPRAGWALAYLGQTYWGRNDLIKAEQYEQQALEILKKTLGEEHPAVAGSLMQISIYRLRRGDFTAAMSDLQAATAIADKALEPEDQLSLGLAHNLGNLYLEQNDYDRAEPLTDRVLKAAEKKYGPDSYILISPLQNLGTIARNKEQYDRALELLGRAEAIAEKQYGPQNPDTAALLINIGNVYRDEKDLAKAVEYFQRALRVLEVSAGPYHDWTRAAIANLADTYAELGDKPHALEYEVRVAHVIDKQIEFNLVTGSERQRLAYSDWMADRTDLTISFHIQKAPQDKTAAELAALTIIRRKARVLDSVSGNLAAIRQRMKPDDQKLIDDLGSTDTQLAKVALSGPGKTAPAEYLQQLHRLEDQKEKLEIAISERGAGHFEPIDSITLSAVQAAIPVDGALVELAVYRPYDPGGVHREFGEPRYCAYVIRHQGEIRWADLGSAKEIDKSASALRDAMQDPARNDVQQLARSAGKEIFWPIRPLVGDATHLLIAPDGELDLIPFEALLDEQGHYLVEKFSVTYLSTGRDLLRMQAPRESKSAPLLVANPDFGQPGSTMVAKVEKTTLSKKGGSRRSITTGETLSDVYFAPLSGTEREVRAIQVLFPEAQMLTGAEATKSALERVDAPQILHIATHGFFLEDQKKKSSAESAPSGTTAKKSDTPDELENPLLRSGLALAGANSNRAGTGGGILTALEASNLNLWGTKLVTLSACDTGLGDVKNGEGVYGLRRAFVLAGAETLVMSLWPVSDEITRELMTSYYTGLRKGLGRGEALHQMQLAMLRRKGRQHPFYWASFIQSGEWAHLDGKR